MTPLAAAGLAALVGGCADDRPVGVLGYVEGFLGGAIADEPRAALIGRDVLSAGGTAADAAVAMYMAMAVTMPSSVGIGGGGSCVVWDPVQEKLDAIDFTPPAVGNAAMPTALRGLFALHARYGRLRWSEVLAPAEGQARFGMTVSRAFATELSAHGGRIRRDRRAPGGVPFASGEIAEGTTVTQIALSAVIGSVRGQGVGAFYQGPLARQVIADYRAVGVDLDEASLRGYTPEWRTPPIVEFGDHLMGFTPGPGSAGARAAESVHLTLDGPSREENVAGADSPPVGRGAGAGSATLIAVDRNRLAVACAATMNAPFGLGRIGPETGIVVGAAPGAQSAPVVGALIGNPNTGDFFGAFGARGPDAPRGVTVAAIRSVEEEQTAQQAVTGAPGGVNAMACPVGLDADPNRCTAAAAPGGHGLAAVAEQEG